MASRPSTEVQAYIIPNQVQGVSQQAAQERRDTQCTAQFDCINSPVNGCEARPGFDFLARIHGVDLSASFAYEIFRGNSEHYLVVIAGEAYGPDTPRKLHVYDLNTGQECAVTFTADESYLAVSNFAPRDGFVATTLEDTTFIGNKEIAPAISTTLLSPPKKNNALLYFKAGGYSVTFQVAVTYAGKIYTWTYVTPDNSTVNNAPYISTNNLAATFFRSFTGVDPVRIASGTEVEEGDPQTCTISTAAACTVTATAHGLSAGDDFKFSTTGALPSGVVAGLTYYVIADGLGTDTFRFSETPGGTAVVAYGSSSGSHTYTEVGVGGSSGSCTLSTSYSEVSATSHGLSAGQVIQFETTGALPTRVFKSVAYYVLATGITANSFRFSTSPGGVAVAAYGSQSGTHSVKTGLSPSYVSGVGPSSTGGTTGSVTGSITLTSLGFSVSINGNLILISRDDDEEFTIDTGDGVGDTYLRCIKDTAQAFSDLPKSCFSGFICKVIGTNRQSDDDYYVEFVGGDGSSGYWREAVAPGTPLTFDETTMPYVLFNSDVNTFEFKAAPWGERVSGDGVDSSKDPSFIGKYIKDLFYDHSRFGIMTEGSTTWARARNPYLFFPDTAQTVLDTDPVDIKVGGGRTIALLRRLVQAGEATLLWAEKIQFRVHSGTNSFRQDTVEAPPTKSYEFSPNASPSAVGGSLYFVSEPGDFSMVRDLTVRDGKPGEAADVTEHVPRYIPKGVRWVAGSDTLRMLVLDSEATPNHLYVYNYLLSPEKRIQSAWNTWRLPSGCKVLWVSVSRNFCHLLVQRGTEEAVFLKVDLSVNLVDPIDGAQYLTRLDFRTTEQACTLSYDPGADLTTITLPYRTEDVAGYVEGDPAPMFVANAVGSESYVRGRVWPIKSISETAIVVSGDCRQERLYIGYRISAEREPSRFYLKGPQGLIPTSRLLVKDYVVAYAHTGYFRAVVTYRDTPESVHEMTGRRFGDPANVMGSYPISEGFFQVPIDTENDAYTVRLVNDSFLPSRWTSATYNFHAALLARPSSYGQGAG